MKKYQALKFSFIVFVLIQCFLPETKVIAQREVSYMIFGMPQRTFMYGKTNAKNEAIIRQTYYPEVPRTITRNPSYNAAMGIYMIKPIAGQIALRIGLVWAPQEQYYSTKKVVLPIPVKSSIRLKYIKIPVCFQYNYLQTSRIKLFAAAGPELNILISENGSIPVFGINVNFLSFDMVDPGDAYQNFVLGGMIHLGGEIKMEKYTSFVIGASADATFTAVEKKSFTYLHWGYVNKIFDDPNVTLRTKSNIAAGVYVGLIFKIKPKTSSE